MPALTRPCTARWVSGMPSSSTHPWRGRRIPMMVRNSVVLPAPLRPMRPANWPAPTSRLTWRRMLTGPSETETPSSRSMGRLLADHVAPDGGGAQHLARIAVGDHAAFIERDDAIGVALNDIHVVLDEQHDDAGRAA